MPNNQHVWCKLKKANLLLWYCFDYGFQPGVNGQQYPSQYDSALQAAGNPLHPDDAGDWTYDPDTNTWMRSFIKDGETYTEVRANHT